MIHRRDARIRRAVVCLLTVLVCATAVAAVADSHPFSIHDMLAMERISDAQLSPGGERIVFTKRSTDLSANRGRTDLWLIGVDGGGLRQLTADPAGDFNPR